VELAIDVLFINKYIFFTTYSTKICFHQRLSYGRYGA
jgi:hypothetical protein